MTMAKRKQKLGDWLALASEDKRRMNGITDERAAAL
jgi:hypothetical protein